MKMIIKIVIWWMLFYGMLVFDSYILAVHDMMILVSITHILLLLVYLVLLYWEIRARINNAATQKQLRWAGFYFTFWIGLVWVITFSAGVGHHPLFAFHDPVTLFTYIFSGIAGGIMIGIVGMAITQFMVLFIFKQREQV